MISNKKDIDAKSIKSIMRLCVKLGINELRVGDFQIRREPTLSSHEPKPTATKQPKVTQTKEPKAPTNSRPNDDTEIDRSIQMILDPSGYMAAVENGEVVGEAIHNGLGEEI